MTEASSVPSSSTAPDALLRKLDGPAFAEPWMAQVFACAVHLSRQGLFTWNECVDVFSAEIKAHPQKPGEAANAAYYRQWLAALETIVGLKGAASTTEITERQETWRQAYLNTPHGQPVELHHAGHRLQRRQTTIATMITINTLRNQSASARHSDSANQHTPPPFLLRDRLRPGYRKTERGCARYGDGSAL